MRHHPIHQGPGQAACPRCGRTRLIFLRPDRIGDVYQCDACGLESWHLVGRHFHGLWSLGARERVSLCPAYMFEPATLTAERRITTTLRTLPRCRRHRDFAPSCEVCRSALGRRLAAEIEAALVARFGGEDWSALATAEVRRMFGVDGG